MRPPESGPRIQGRRTLKYLITVVATLALSVGLANAQFYVGAHGGLSLQSESTLTDKSGVPPLIDVDVDFDAGGTVGGVLGYRFPLGRNSIDAEVEATYRTNGIDTASALGVTVPVAGDLTSVAVMANGWFNFGTGTPFTPYVGGGLGFVFIETDGVSIGGVAFPDDDDTVFGGQFGGGVAYAVTPQLDLTLDYRFLITSDASLKKLQVDAEYMNHSFRAGVKYRF